MSKTAISIPVDAKTAGVFYTASPNYIINFTHDICYTILWMGPN